MSYNTHLAATTGAASIQINLSNYATSLVIVHGLDGVETVPVLIQSAAGFIPYRDSAGNALAFTSSITMLNLPNAVFNLAKALTANSVGIDVIYGQSVVTH